MSTSTQPSAAHARLEMHSHAQRIADALALMKQRLPVQRRMLLAGDTVYQAGEHFASLHVIHSGFFKLVSLSADGREQVVALHFKGDWLGFDGIASSQHGCDAVAMDTGEVWTIRYWIDLLARRGMRTDQTALRMTRAEIGNYLGMTLESVSRAFSRLTREKVICLAEEGRRDVQIPDVAALAAFVRGSLSTATVQ